MMNQLKTLHRVKTLKEEQALRALDAKRRQVADGEAAVERAEAAADESRRNLSSREDAAYSGILGQVVDLEALDDTRAAVVAIGKAHARLTDMVERTTHTLSRLQGELETNAARHRAAAKVKDTFSMLLDDARDKAVAAAEYAEDSEVEDLFSRPRRPLL